MLNKRDPSLLYKMEGNVDPFWGMLTAVEIQSQNTVFLILKYIFTPIYFPDLYD